jgi:8-oxo-dGTP pyrophosphatase MutT (NUDIX family)
MTKGVVACGAVVWRLASSGSGVVEVAIVHRPRYDDWSFAKGKIDAGESIEECARREVLEETGLVVTLGARLRDVGYIDRRNRPKVVHYWLATVDAPLDAVADAPVFVANDEVDDLRWVTLDDVETMLTYPRDAELVPAIRAALA